MPKILLSVPLLNQKSDGDCLAACAAMTLEYINDTIEYHQLLKILNVASFGAPASNIRNLKQLNLMVNYRITDLAGLKSLIDNGQPVIVFVRTGDLPYWQYATDHALVVVGYENDQILINDPYFDNSPISVPQGDFELAWLERDYYYATVTID